MNWYRIEERKGEIWTMRGKKRGIKRWGNDVSVESEDRWRIVGLWMKRGKKRE